jgi:hypothetical protein
MCAKIVQRLLGAGGFDHLKISLLQEGRGEFPEFGLVFDNQRNT